MSLRRENRSLIVLTYHNVTDRETAGHPELHVGVDRFRNHIASLRSNGWSSISVADWLSWTQHGKELPARPILITFDDAYAELEEFALPALRENGWTATVFAISRKLGTRTLWDDSPMAGGSQLLSWSGSGIDIGAHSRTHPDLTQLDAETMRDEIRGSREDLEHLLGTSVLSFAYPSGRYDEVSAGVVRETYSAGFTTVHGMNDGLTDCALLKRMMVMPEDPARLLLPTLKSNAFARRIIRGVSRRLAAGGSLPPPSHQGSRKL